MRKGGWVLILWVGLAGLGCPDNQVALPGEGSSSGGNQTMDPDGGGVVGMDDGGMRDAGQGGSSGASGTVSSGRSGSSSGGSVSSGGASSTGSGTNSSAGATSSTVSGPATSGVASSGVNTSSVGTTSVGGTSSPASSVGGSSAGASSVGGGSSVMVSSSAGGTTSSGVTSSSSVMTSSSAAPSSSGPMPNVCQGQPNGLLCPGSNDPNNGERCLNNVCVGTYVSPAGDSNNPGTRASPKRFIVEGLAVAQALGGQDTVFVGKLMGPPAIYNEDVRIPPETNLSGAWLHDGGSGWTRDVAAHETRITGVTAEGLIVQSGATRTNVTVSGIRVVGLDTGNAETTAVTLRTNSSATFQDVTIQGGVSQTNSVGMRITNQDNPLLQRVSITGGTGNASVALRVSQGRAEIRDSTLQGGTAVAGSVGLQCEGGCPGLQLITSTVGGGSAQDAAAVNLSGDVSGVTVTGSDLTGGPGGLNPGAPAYTGRRAGVAVDNCPTLTLNPQVVTVETSTVRGVTLPGAVGVTMGIYVAGNCGVLARNNALISGAAPGAGPTDTLVDQAYGVLCSGSGSDCTLEANTLIVGTHNVLGAQAGSSARVLAAGVALEGDATVRGRAAQDSTRLIQRIVGGVAPNAVGLSHAPGLVGSAVGTLLVEYTQLEGGTCTGTDAERGVAGVVVATPARLINNVILGGECDNRATGLLLHPSINSALGQQPLVLNNHIDAVGSPLLTAASAGVTVAPLNGLNVPLPTNVGNIVNNTILAGVAGISFCVAESTANVDVAQLRHNNLFGGTFPYLDEGNNVVLTIGDVNNLPGATNNIRLDPQVDATFHLGPMSPNRDAGQRNGGGISAPELDFDGERRPIPSNQNPDIGPDERN